MLKGTGPSEIILGEKIRGDKYFTCYSVGKKDNYEGHHIQTTIFMRQKASLD